MRILSILFAFIALFLVKNAFARGGITYGEVTKIETVADLPNTKEYQISAQAEDGREITGFIDLAIKYRCFEVAKMPFWITEEPILVWKNSFYRDSYFDLTPKELDAILKGNKLNKNELLQLGFMQKYSGWLSLIVFLIVVFILKKKFFR